MFEIRSSNVENGVNIVEEAKKCEEKRTLADEMGADVGLVSTRMSQTTTRNGKVKVVALALNQGNKIFSFQK